MVLVKSKTGLMIEVSATASTAASATSGLQHLDLSMDGSNR
jgi:hypothetical protein